MLEFVQGVPSSKLKWGLKLLFNKNQGVMVEHRVEYVLSSFYCSTSVVSKCCPMSMNLLVFPLYFHFLCLPMKLPYICSCSFALLYCRE